MLTKQRYYKHTKTPKPEVQDLSIRRWIWMEDFQSYNAWRRSSKFRWHILSCLPELQMIYWFYKSFNFRYFIFILCYWAWRINISESGLSHQDFMERQLLCTSFITFLKYVWRVGFMIELWEMLCVYFGAFSHFRYLGMLRALGSDLFVFST